MKTLLPSFLLAAIFLPFATAPASAQDPKALFQQSMGDMRKGDNAQAIADLTQAIQLNPQYVEAYFRRSFVYMLTSEDDKAIADLGAALRINPQFEKGYYRRSFVYMLKGDYDSAVTDLTQAIRLNPKSTQNYARRAYACMLKGSYDQAIADFDQTLQLDSSKTGAFFNRIRAYTLKGDYAHALAYLNEAIQTYPDDPYAYNRIAWFLSTCPDPSFRDGKKALDYALKGDELANGNAPAIVDTVAAAYAETGDFASAIKWENQFLETPNLDASRLADGQKRLALYQSNKPYHPEKFDPHFELIVRPPRPLPGAEN